MRWSFSDQFLSPVGHLHRRPFTSSDAPKDAELCTTVCNIAAYRIEHFAVHSEKHTFRTVFPENPGQHLTHSAVIRPLMPPGKLTCLEYAESTSVLSFGLERLWPIPIIDASEAMAAITGTLCALPVLHAGQVQYEIVLVERKMHTLPLASGHVFLQSQGHSSTGSSHRKPRKRLQMLHTTHKQIAPSIPTSCARFNWGPSPATILCIFFAETLQRH